MAGYGSDRFAQERVSIATGNTSGPAMTRTSARSRARDSLARFGVGGAGRTVSGHEQLN